MGRGSYNIIPEGEKHCVWMDAGLINYKLCDKNFECESCPFDIVMQTQYRPVSDLAGTPTEPPSSPRDSSKSILEAILVQLIQPLKRTPLPADRLYFSNHSWVRRENDGQWRIGVDGLLAHLVNPLLGAVVVNTPAHVEKDSPFAWLLRDADTLSLHASIAGTVTETNSLLTSKPALLTSDPYDQGWIMMIASHGAKAESMKCYSADQFQQCMNNDIQSIESLLTSTLTRQQKEIGESLFDGGVRIQTIEQFIGSKRYGQLLARLLRPQSR